MGGKESGSEGEEGAREREGGIERGGLMHGGSLRTCRGQASAMFILRGINIV